MSNTLFQALNKQNDFSKMMNSFNQFSNAFKGNAKQEVQRLLNSGEMSQAEFNKLQQMATDFQNTFKMK